MLYFMRHSMKAFVMWLIIAAFVGTIFYAWGMRSARFGKGGRGWIAKVEGAQIAPEEYEKELADLEARVRDLPPELVKQLNLKQQALDAVINRHLLLAEADRLGIRISDGEIAAAIEATPAFQENGVFSRRAYEAVLAGNRLTPSLFERRQRDALRIGKLQGLIQDSVKVTDDEVAAAYAREKEKVVVDYARITAQGRMPAEAPPGEEVQKYFAAHKEAFRTLEEVNAAFCYLTPQDFFDRIEVPDDEVARSYDRNKSLYVQPEKVHARHILIRVPRDAGAETQKAAREKIEGILEQARGGADFAELARQYSEDSTASKGGDLGTFARGQMEKSFDNAAFGLKPGEISPVVRTPFGYHIIKVEERTAEKTRTLEQVRGEILRELKSERGMRVVRREAMRMYAEIRKGGDFREAAKTRNLTVRETGYFSRKDSRIQGVPEDLAQRFSEEAFAAGRDGIGGVVKGERGYLLLQVVDRKDSRIPDLDEVRDQVVRAVQEQAARDAAREAAEKMAAGLNRGEAFASLVESAAPADQGTTGAFTRAETLFSPAFTRTAFTLTEEKPAAYLEDGADFYVLSLKERLSADEAALETEADRIRSNLIQEKRNSLFASWLEQARKQTRLELNQELIERL